MSRAYTKEEVTTQLISHLQHMAKYWSKTDLSGPEFDFEDETLYRLEGLLHSVLVALDGGSMGLPAFNLTPSPHPEDKEYLISEGENYYEPIVINDDVQLHELLRRVNK